jgi:hypothetical protein
MAASRGEAKDVVQKTLPIKEMWRDGSGTVFEGDSSAECGILGLASGVWVFAL